MKTDEDNFKGFFKENFLLLYNLSIVIFILFKNVKFHIYDYYKDCNLFLLNIIMEKQKYWPILAQKGGIY